MGYIVDTESYGRRLKRWGTIYTPAVATAWLIEATPDYIVRDNPFSPHVLLGCAVTLAGVTLEKIGHWANNQNIDNSLQM